MTGASVNAPYLLLVIGAFSFLYYLVLLLGSALAYFAAGDNEVV